MFYVIRKRQANFSRTTLAALSRVVKVSCRCTLHTSIDASVLQVTVETGVLSAIFASVNLYLFLAYDGNNTHLVVCSWFSKIYSNSVLVVSHALFSPPWAQSHLTIGLTDIELACVHRPRFAERRKPGNERRRFLELQQSINCAASFHRN
jgi:hypothetical protein